MNNHKTQCNLADGMHVLRLAFLVVKGIIEAHILDAHPENCECEVHQTFRFVDRFYDHGAGLLDDSIRLLASGVDGSRHAARASLIATIIQVANGAHLTQKYVNAETPEGWREQCVRLKTSVDFLVASAAVLLSSLDCVVRRIPEDPTMPQIYHMGDHPITRYTCHSQSALVWGMMGLRTAAITATAEVKERFELGTAREEILDCIEKINTIGPEYLSDMVFVDLVEQADFVDTASSVLAEVIFALDALIARPWTDSEVASALVWIRDGACAWIAEAAAYEAEQSASV